ncbi:MAG TPA: ABC transporter ATP-binding protein [Candidatus Acidoferrum sp.]|nr:ABC transporter ATP-binding protein [Candidatus Acidoferrum sp.]
MLAIETEGLCKAYRVGFWGRRVEVLRDLTLQVQAGEIFGYLGPNGAGKSTTIKLLLGLVQRTAGSAEVLGLPSGEARARRRIGFLPENPSFYEYLTGQEFLTYCGRLLGVPRPQLRQQVRSLLGEVGLSRAADQQVRKYSKGMVQRLGLAQALLGDPELLILDEPMSGLDPIGRKEVRDLILRQKAAGRTVFFSTHILPDVEMICDRVGILVGGSLVKTGPMAELLGEELESIEVIAEAVPETVRREVEVLALGPALSQGGRMMFRLRGEAELQKTLETLVVAGSRVLSVIPQRRGLEEIFLAASREARP